MKSNPVPHQEVEEPEYPGLLASMVMVFLGWKWVANYSMDFFWAATGISESYLWQVARTLTTLIFAFVCYTVQPARGVSRYFALQPIPWRAAIRIPICYAGVVAITMAAGVAFYQTLALIGLSREDISHPPDTDDRIWFVRLLSALFVAPLTEELLMRGLVLQGLLQRYSAGPAILVSSFIFGLYHGNVAQAVLSTVSGCFFGWAFVQTRSLLVPILMHSTHNGFMFLLTALIEANIENLHGHFKFPIVPSRDEGWRGELALTYGALFLVAGVGLFLFVSSFRAFRHAFFQSAAVSATGTVDVLQPEMPLADFKTRRTAKSSIPNRTPESGDGVT